ncbi:MAG: ACP S-malonyltransferase [Planctomycetes bacterium]|nr:ACP S-malonyltransferase [Planctomycetota bacterium]
MSRIALLCPGRGSYAEKQLASLPASHPWIDAAEGIRREHGLQPLAELDRAAKFDRKVHLHPANVSPLIYLVSMLDAAAVQAEHRAVAVAGNSLGWYTALAVGGALSFEDGFRLVQEMSRLQHEHQEAHGGGQVIFPLVGEDWRRDPAREEAVEAAVASSGGEAFPSIRLAGLAVLAGSDAGIAHLKSTLPKVKSGSNQYPIQLEQHGPYHTPLVSGVAERARATLSHLAFTRPRVTLIDGRGVRFSPWSTDVDALRSYTLGPQIVEPFDFGLSIRVALREHAPEHLVCPGPGNTLGGVVGQALVAEGWRGIRDKEDFTRVQEGAQPVLVSMRR